MSESLEQQHVVSWFRLQYPGKIIFAIPNGAWLSGDAKRRAILMNKMKREGLVAGVSDLFIAFPRKVYTSGSVAVLVDDCAGLFLEMKDKAVGSVSGNQARFMEDMLDAGYAAEWAAGFEQAKAIIKNYMEGR